MVTNCFCFDLKYGYLAYASISVTLRTAFILFFYYNLQLSLYHTNEVDAVWIGALIGWNSIATLFCFLAIAGIMKDRSLFIYTYIVILISEVIIFDILMIVCSFLLTPYFIFGVFILSGVYSYDVMCLISLYKRIKNKKAQVVYQNVVIQP